MNKLIKRIHKLPILLAVIGALAFWSAGCGFNQNSPFKELINTGMLPLSPSDAFLGSNLFMAKEIEKSIYLHNFVQSRGAPSAIELLQDVGAPLRMLLFYPWEKAVYVGVLEDRHLGEEWVIRGPYQVTWQDDQRLDRLRKTMQGVPVFYLWGKEFRFKQFVDRKNTKPVEAELPPPPTPKPTPKKKKPIIIRHPETPVSPSPTATPTPGSDIKVEDYRNLSSDQKAILQSQGYAPRNDEGNLLHSVKQEGETFDTISRWYTDSPGNAKAIADANKLDPAVPLKPGTKIVVPSNITKKNKVMPGDFK